MKDIYDYLNDVKTDFRLYEEETITQEEINNMKAMISKNKNKKTGGMVIGIAAAVAVATGVAAADGNFDGIINTFTTGHNIFVQTDPNAVHVLPEELQGKLFDAQGNPVTALKERDGLGKVYDKEGKLLTEKEIVEIFDDAFDGAVDFTEESQADKVIYSTLEEAQKAADFNIKYPDYLPEGYSFDCAHNYKGKSGKTSGLYMTLEFKNTKGDVIYIYERLLNEETAFKMSSSGTMEEMTVNGRKTVVENGKNASFETEDNVSVMISAKNGVSKKELIKIVESIG